MVDFYPQYLNTSQPMQTYMHITQDNEISPTSLNHPYY